MAAPERPAVGLLLCLVLPTREHSPPAEGGLKPPRVRNGDDNNAVQVGYVG